jgi:hypothetical protein
MFVCVLCAFCVRFFCFYIVSSETASRPNKRLMRTYDWISLFMSYKVNKLAYRIWVILIANERVTKKIWKQWHENTNCEFCTAFRNVSSCSLASLIISWLNFVWTFEYFKRGNVILLHLGRTQTSVMTLMSFFFFMLSVCSD